MVFAYFAGMYKDVTGRAIMDYHAHTSPARLWIYNRYGPKEEMPVGTYFRSEPEMPVLELAALKQCRGKVLDVGAGAGSHALILQQRGFDVTGLDISPLSVQVMQERGLRQTVCADILTYKEDGFDTLLMLMNGVGLSGTLAGLELFLQHARTLLRPGGQLLMDSSDVAYLYHRKPMPQQKYYGEIDYQYSYKSQKTDWFTWLYIDQQTLTDIAGKQGWNTEVLFEDGNDQYLARLLPAG